MKSALTSLLLLIAAASLSAQANDTASAVDVCDAGLRLSLSQHHAIRGLEQETAAQLRSTRAEIHRTRAFLSQLMGAINATKEEAIATRAILAEKVALVRGLEEQKDLIIAFDILTPEQRVKKSRCLEAARGPRPLPGHHRRVGPPLARPLPPLPGRVERRHIPAPNRHHRRTLRTVIVRH